MNMKLLLMGFSLLATGAIVGGQGPSESPCRNGGYESGRGDCRGDVACMADDEFVFVQQVGPGKGAKGGKGGGGQGKGPGGNGQGKGPGGKGPEGKGPGGMNPGGGGQGQGQPGQGQKGKKDGKKGPPPMEF